MIVCAVHLKRSCINHNISCSYSCMATLPYVSDAVATHWTPRGYVTTTTTTEAQPPPPTQTVKQACFDPIPGCGPDPRASSSKDAFIPWGWLCMHCHGWWGIIMFRQSRLTWSVSFKLKLCICFIITNVLLRCVEKTRRSHNNRFPTS